MGPICKGIQWRLEVGEFPFFMGTPPFRDGTLHSEDFHWGVSTPHEIPMGPRVSHVRIGTPVGLGYPTAWDCNDSVQVLWNSGGLGGSPQARRNPSRHWEFPRGPWESHGPMGVIDSVGTAHWGVYHGPMGGSRSELTFPACPTECKFPNG